ncbi:hypothetical protein K3495_g9877 [Podosphaera aphanis]|nr:hypothetical protein K3495_g9877 [Podosphaera aphanis]
MSNSYGVPGDHMDVAFSTPSSSPSRQDMPPPTYEHAPPISNNQADPSTQPPQPVFSPPPPPPASTQINLLPPALWSLPYLSHSTEILNTATLLDPVRVSELFAASAQSQPPPPSTHQPPPSAAATTIVSQPTVRIAAPRIAEYDGSSANLRPFCSLLVNQIQGFENQFPDEVAKVRYAYQCLGPGALVKMRSSFRCLEDPLVPPEITTLEGFILALKLRCQDPGLGEKANRALECLYQKNTPFC